MPLIISMRQLSDILLMPRHALFRHAAAAATLIFAAADAVIYALLFAIVTLLFVDLLRCCRCRHSCC